MPQRSSGRPLGYEHDSGHVSSTVALASLNGRPVGEVQRWLGEGVVSQSIHVSNPKSRKPSQTITLEIKVAPIAFAGRKKILSPWR